MNARRTMYKLQTALCAKGTRIKINQQQYWNDEAKRMITKYVVKEDGIWEPLLESYKPHEVVQFLVELLNGGDGE